MRVTMQYIIKSTSDKIRRNIQSGFKDVPTAISCTKEIASSVIYLLRERKNGFFFAKHKDDLKKISRPFVEFNEFIRNSGNPDYIKHILAEESIDTVARRLLIMDDTVLAEQMDIEMKRNDRPSPLYRAMQVAATIHVCNAIR